MITAYCNSTDSENMQCFGLVFAKPGKYRIELSIAEASDQM